MPKNRETAERSGACRLVAEAKYFHALSPQAAQNAKLPRQPEVGPFVTLGFNFANRAATDYGFCPLLLTRILNRGDEEVNSVCCSIDNSTSNSSPADKAIQR